MLRAQDKYTARTTYPLAAWRPNPLLPPVTTATLPSRLKMLPKSFSWTSTSADMANAKSGIRVVEEGVLACTDTGMTLTLEADIFKSRERAKCVCR